MTSFGLTTYMSDRNSVITATSYYILAEPLHNKLDQDPSLRVSALRPDYGYVTKNDHLLALHHGY